MARNLFAVMLAVASMASSAQGAPLLEQKGQFGPEPQSETERIAVEVPQETPSLLLDTTVTLKQGRVSVRVFSPKGERLFDAATSGSMTLSSRPLYSGGEAGAFYVVVVPEKAVGTWSVTVRAGGPPDLRRLYLLLVSAAGMIAVAWAAVAAWRLASHAAWRWFWVGAAVWTVGVAMKFAWAIPLNGPILGAMKSGLPHDLYLALGSVYIGILTGVFEIGVTLIAGMIWKGMARDATRGVAVGVGAGAFEALVLGLVAFLSAAAGLLATGQIQGQILAATAGAAAVTPLFWLVGTVERVIAIACHTASRALVLVGIARGKWGWPFTIAFLLMSAIDAVAGYVHLSGVLGRISTWWIELAIAPAAVASIPLLVWSIRHWPTPEPSPSDRETDAITPAGADASSVASQSTDE